MEAAKSDNYEALPVLKINPAKLAPALTMDGTNVVTAAGLTAAQVLIISDTDVVLDWGDAPDASADGLWWPAGQPLAMMWTSGDKLAAKAASGTVYIHALV